MFVNFCCALALMLLLPIDVWARLIAQLLGLLLMGLVLMTAFGLLLAFFQAVGYMLRSQSDD
jgi:hypothetical protein